MPFGSKAKEYKEKKKPSVDIPYVVRVFERHIKSWSSSNDVVFAVPKEALYNTIIFRSEKISLADRKWYVNAIFEAVEVKETNNKTERLYRVLKNMECEMVSEGLLRRRFFFKPSDFLNEIRSYIPEINVSDDLAKTLNENQEIMTLIRSIRPDRIIIALHSLPEKSQHFLSSKETVIQAMVDFYKKPEHTTWNIALSLGILPHGLSVQSKADKIMRLLDEITRVLRKKMRELELA